MRIYFFAAFMASFLGSFSQAKRVNTESAIQLVTIFSSGAQVQRNASLPLAPGRTEVVFTGISNQIDQQTIRLQADASITLLSVQTEKDFLGRRKIESEEQGLIDRKNSLVMKIEDDQKLLAVYKAEEEMIIKNQAIGGTTGVKAEELKKALDLQRERLTEVYQKQLAIERRIRMESSELQSVNRQIGEVGKKKDSISYSVVALVESKQSRTINFKLTYTVKDAGWHSSYDVRLLEVGKPLSFLMNANVHQRSGEDWNNVSLLLSTGNPADNATPAILQKWLLGYYDPSVGYRNAIVPGEVSGRVVDESGNPVYSASVQISGTNSATATDANGFFRLQRVPLNGSLIISAVGYNTKSIMIRPGYYTITLSASQTGLQEVVVVGYGTSRSEDAAPRLAGKVAGIQTVTVETRYQPTTTIYKIEDKYSILSDGKTTTIGIREFDVDAAEEYFSAPKIDPAVFLTAKITDWENYELQSGEASLYFEGTYLGKTYLDLSAVGDTLSLSLGKDNGVKISRKLVTEFSSKKLIGTNRTESKVYEITVRNTKNVAVNVVVQDQFPVSVNKDIEVNEEKAPEAQVNKEDGIATWNLTLKPGEEKKLRISYSVKYPKDRRVDL